MARKPAKKKASTVTIDWSDADIKNFLSRAGEYRMKVVSAEEEDEKIIVVLEVTEGPQEGKQLKNYFNLEPKSLWFLAKFLEAVGVDIPDSEEDLDLDELVDKELLVDARENEYDGKTYIRARDFVEAPSKGKTSSKSKKDTDDDKSAKGKDKKKAEKISGDALADMSEDELEEVIKNYELDVDLDDFKTLRKKAAAVSDALETAGMLED